MTDTAECKNTDVIVWRADWQDHDSPALFITEGNGIGMNVGGTVRVRPIEDWMRSEAEVDRLRTLLHDKDVALVRVQDLLNDIAMILPPPPGVSHAKATVILASTIWVEYQYASRWIDVFAKLGMLKLTPESPDRSAPPQAPTAP